MLTHVPLPHALPREDLQVSKRSFIWQIFAKDLKGARHWEYGSEQNSRDGEAYKQHA